MKNRENLLWIIGVIVVLLIVTFLIIKSANKKESASEEIQEELIASTPAMVSSIELITRELFPVEVVANVEGNLPDGCSVLGEPLIDLEGNMFTVDLPSLRPQDAICTQELQPFIHSIEIPVLGLPMGFYEININGVMGGFELFVDNEVTSESEK